MSTPRVLVLRASEQAHETADLLRENGFAPVLAPVVRIEFPDLPELAEALALLAPGPTSETDRVAWLVLTSANAVAALPEEVADRLDPDVRIAAVGHATARAATTRGLTVDLVPEQATGLALAEAIGPAPAPAHNASSRSARRIIVLPRSDLARPDLPRALAAQGWDVRDVVAYRTAPADRVPAPISEALGAGRIFAVLLTSPSTLRGMLDLIGRPAPSTHLIAIGPTTANALRESGFTPVDGGGTMPTVIEALVRLLDRSPSQIEITSNPVGEANEADATVHDGQPTPGPAHSRNTKRPTPHEGAQP